MLTCASWSAKQSIRCVVLHCVALRAAGRGGSRLTDDLPKPMTYRIRTAKSEGEPNRTTFTEGKATYLNLDLPACPATTCLPCHHPVPTALHPTTQPLPGHYPAPTTLHLPLPTHHLPPACALPVALGCGTCTGLGVGGDRALAALPATCCYRPGIPGRRRRGLRARQTGAHRALPSAAW